VIRSALDYGTYFVKGLFDARTRALLVAHTRPIVVPGVQDTRAGLAAAIGYLLRAQQQGADMGMGSYHLGHGWGASYPETTGYAIPTLLRAGRVLEREEPVAAALRAGEWLLSIQRSDGGWQGGRVGEQRPSIVFNTAQVVRGMLALYAHHGGQRYIDAAVRAAHWIARSQEADGTWRTHNFLGAARVYDTYVDAPLLRVFAITGEPLLRNAAERNLQWVLNQRNANGWFANCDNTVAHNDRPITHTIAYTLDGLLECHEMMPNGDIVEAATVGGSRLLHLFMSKGTLKGRYDASWRGTEHPILTGCAQMAIVWSKLSDLTSDPRYREGQERMTRLLLCMQERSTFGPDAVLGALPGSYPLWGRYEKFAFPNWSTKYFADALLSDRSLSRTNDRIT